MLPTPDELSALDPRASRLLTHIRRRLERDGIRGATQQTIALRCTAHGYVCDWFKPLLGKSSVRRHTVNEANRTMYATGWQIKKATPRRATQLGNPSYNMHLHLQMDFDPARMPVEDPIARKEEERQAAISELEAEMEALRERMEAIRAA